MNKTTVAQQAKTTNIFQPAQGVLQRKCACGNQTVANGECVECAKKKSSLQRKLAIGASNDPLEKEADRIADQVIAMPTNSYIGSAPPRIQRFTSQPAGQINAAAPTSVDRVLARSGKPLEPALRQEMEQRFSHDFSQVRVHSGSAAEQSTRDVSAHAYTAGHNVVFGAGQFAPRTHEGRWLLAHELTHVVQQSGPEGNRLAQSGNKHALSAVSLQRHVLENDPSTSPAMVCPTPLSSVADYLFTTNFTKGGATVSPLEKEVLDGFKTEWNLSPVQPKVRVDGFASKDGGPNDNWPLSCDRALAVASELNARTSGGKPGIPAGSIEFFANGETEFFSASSLAPNRVAAIHAPGMATPTSREPSVHSWTVNSGPGATAADNCCGLCPVNLGVNCDPPNFRNGIEFNIAIRDHDPTYSYDIKRTLEAKAHKRAVLLGVLSGPWSNFFSKPAGSDDDSHDSDECLVPIASGSTHKIYSEDRPGFKSPLSNANNALMLKANFIEFVRISRSVGTTYDDARRQRWHTKILVEKISGTWTVNIAESEIGTGHLGSLDP